MKTKKNIDKLFQEQLSEHEVLPPNMVWNNIEEKLKEKKKRRVIPFWWKLSGIAALFVIGLGFYNWQFNDSKTISNDNTIVNENTIDNVKSKNDQNNLNRSRDLNATKNLNENSKLTPDAEVVVNNENEKSAKKEKKDSGLGNNSSKENDNIVAETQIIKRGKQFVNAQCEIWNADKTRLIARGTSNLFKINN